MSIEDIKIEIKKYDKAKNVVILNLVLFEQLEIRGFVVRFTITKYSPAHPVWVVTPPSVKVKKDRWFHWVRFMDKDLWKQLEKEIIDAARVYTNLI